jgi:Ca-activated chloride channel family protein
MVKNNAGVVKPMEAAQLAKALNIRVYSIGILSPGSEVMGTTATDSIYYSMNIPSAETVLLQVSELTGGKYFRATNEKKLSGIYDEIDRFEKTKVDMVTYSRYEERFYLFAIIAAFALLLELLFSYTFFRTAP